MAKKDISFGNDFTDNSDHSVLPIDTDDIKNDDTNVSKGPMETPRVREPGTMMDLVEVTDGDADMLKLGLAQNICYLCGKEFKYRIQLKKHLSKFHNDANKDTEIIAKTDNVNDDIKVANETKQGVDRDIVNPKSSTTFNAEATVAEINETGSDNNDSDDHIPVGDSNSDAIGERGFNAKTFVANLNKSIVTSDDGEPVMNFEEVSQIPNEVSDLFSNSTETFAETGDTDLDADDVGEDAVEGLIVIGKHDNKYIRSKTDPSRLKYDCEQCDLRFEFPYQLKRHTNIVHEGKYPYSCDVCGKAFDRISTVKDHMLVHTNERPHRCKLCGVTFKMNGNLKKHMLKHGAEKMYKCEHCTSRFMFREQLISHLVIHTGEKPFSCDVCSKTFARKTNLKEHLVIHTTEKKYPCSMCDKVFLRPYSRKVHMRNHMEHKPHKCTVCSASFSQRSALTQHMRRHTGERPFNCRYCHRNFAQQSTLITHVALHTGMKNFKCTYCEKAFLRKRCLVEHIRVHTNETPYKCDKCGYASKTKNGLDRHRERHSESKDFICSICKKAFLRKRSYINHCRIHTGERPYCCNVCPFTTTTLTNLNRHVRMHIRKIPNSLGMGVKEFKRLSLSYIEQYHPEAAESISNPEKPKVKHIRKSSNEVVTKGGAECTDTGILENTGVETGSENLVPDKTKSKVAKRKRPSRKRVKTTKKDANKVGTNVLRALLLKKPTGRKVRTKKVGLSTCKSTENDPRTNLNCIKETTLSVFKNPNDACTQTPTVGVSRKVSAVFPATTEQQNKPAMSGILRTLLQKDKCILENLTLVSDIVSSVRHKRNEDELINIKNEIPSLADTTSIATKFQAEDVNVKTEPSDLSNFVNHSGSYEPGVNVTTEISTCSPGLIGNNARSLCGENGEPLRMNIKQEPKDEISSAPDNFNYTKYAQNFIENHP